jgi:photosynthetic reaction center H subunit
MVENAPYIDLAQIVLYLFWIFFAGVIFYLLRENKREGYPLDTDRLGSRVQVQGWPGIPSPKTYKLANGTEVQSPNGLRDTRPIAAEPVARHGGAPLVPTGNPMLDGVGPAAYAQRADVPDLTTHGVPKIVPLRVAADYHVDSRDADPRGLPVVGADGVVGGTVVDAWVDRSEALLRYLEVDVAGAGRRLLPLNFSRVGRREVRVQAILGVQFKDVPALRSPEQVTLLEEDRICGYYGGGTLYAEPSRQEPLL